VAIMKNNEFIAVGSPEQVITEDNMEKIYGIRVSIVDVGGLVGHKICVPLRRDDATVSKNILLERLANGRGK